MSMLHLMDKFNKCSLMVNSGAYGTLGVLLMLFFTVNFKGNISLCTVTKIWRLESSKHDLLGTKLLLNYM